MASPSKQLKLEERTRQVLPLSASILSGLNANALINYLLLTPNSSNASDALKTLCLHHDFAYIFRYFNSLPMDHWHRAVMKQAMTKRFGDISSDNLHQLGRRYIPLKSAWTTIDGEHVPVMGPLTNMDAAEWDTIDWFFHLLHSRRMEGEPLHVFEIPLLMYKHAILCF